jgi:flagellar biogenesis protein FliO
MKGGREGGRKKEKTQRNKVESKLTMSFPIQVTSLFLFLFLFLLLLLLLVFMFVPFLLCPLTQRNTSNSHHAFDTHTHTYMRDR